MAESGPLTPLEFDAWHLASPLQLLHLIKRLGVESTVIAGWIGVKPAAISQWNRGRREIPARYGPRLRRWAEHALKQAAMRNAKEAAAQPTEALQRAIQTEFAALWSRWKLELLHNAGTLRRTMQQNYQALGQWLARDPLTAEAQESITVVMETIAQQVALLVQLQGDVPSLEDELLARLTAAHVAAQQTREQAQDPGPQTTNPPDREA